MLHGHAKIELTNVKTGEKKVVEHDNMLTNWLRDILTPKGIYGDNFPRGSMVGSRCGRRTFFGGLVVFQNALDSDADSYKFPTDNPMIAHGNNEAYNGTDLTRGSFNSNESAFDDESATFVWDFNQEHGNGTISSLGLCNIWGGMAGAGQRVVDYNSVNPPSYRAIYSLGNTLTYGRPCYFDDENSLMYAVTSMSAGKLKIRKYLYAMNGFDPIVDSVGYYNDVKYNNTNDFKGEETIDLTSYLSGNNLPTYTVDGRYLYIIAPQSDWASGTTKTLVKVDLRTMQITTQSVTNNTGKTLLTGYVYDVSDSGTEFAVWDGCLYCETNDGKYVYINLSDSTDCGMIVDADGNDVTRTGNGAMRKFLNMFGDLYIADEGYEPTSARQSIGARMWRMCGKNIAKRTALAGMYTYYGSWNGQALLTSGGTNAYQVFAYFGNNKTQTEGYMHYNVMCMSTKQNLDTPVTKTADMTMRVTYTIREVSE